MLYEEIKLLTTASMHTEPKNHMHMCIQWFLSHLITAISVADSVLIIMLYIPSQSHLCSEYVIKSPGSEFVAISFYLTKMTHISFCNQHVQLYNRWNTAIIFIIFHSDNYEGIIW